MRCSILIALVILGILPVAASAKTKPAPVLGARLVVTAVQANGQNHPLKGREVLFRMQITHGDTVGGLLDPIRNGRSGVAKTLPFMKAWVGDTIVVCTRTSYTGFGPSRCKSHIFTATDARRAYVFRFRLPWAEPGLTGSGLS